MSSTDKLEIFEIGPGQGSFADSLLEYLKTYELELYRKVRYNLIEISPQLAESTERLLAQKHKWLFENNAIQMFNGSFMDF